MKIAFLSDVHANLPALQTALDVARQRGANRVVYAGDLVGDGPFPAETITALTESAAPVAIRGNVDRKVLGEKDRTRKQLKKRLAKAKPKKQNRIWTALELSKEQRAWLRSLPEELELSVAGQVVLVVHGSPQGDTDYLYSSLTEEGLQGKLSGHQGPRPAVLVAGHSHVPFAKGLNGTLVVNCGSVGRPADGDPRGSFALVEFTGAEPRAEIIRFAYPVEEVCRALEEREVPGVEASEYERGVKS